MTVAITRAASPRLDECVLTHVARERIDVQRALAQHAAYEELLGELGCVVVRAQPLPDNPDSVFVEDTAVVLDDIAIAARPGVESRREEVVSVADVLGRYRVVHRIAEPATLDGGDVLVLGRTVYVGVGQRTNPDGYEQLCELVQPHGYATVAIPIERCLHLKTAVSRVGEDLLVVNPEWVDASAFDGCHCITVHPGEPFAGNALWLDGVVVYAEAHARTRERLEQHHVNVRTVDVSELARAEAGVTCCSIILTRPRGNAHTPGSTRSVSGPIQTLEWEPGTL